MEIEGATIEINGVATEIYAEEMGVEYGDEEKDGDPLAAAKAGPVTIYRLVKREDAEAMGISLVEGSVSTPNHNIKVITRHLIQVKNKPKKMLLTPKATPRLIRMPSPAGEHVADMVSLTDDLSTYQRGPNLFVCELCSKSFRHASHLKRHINTHTAERLYPCDMCGKEYLDASTLCRHRRTHTGEKPYSCDACGKKFGTLGSLRRHMTCHDLDSRPYCCDTCQRRFPDKSSFQKHSLIHTGIKEHVCAVCGKAFVHVGDLNGHKKIHADVKPYKCTRCQRDFSKYSNYSRHLLIHEGDKAYVCHICFVGYNFQSSLTRHLLTHVKREKCKANAVKMVIVAPDGKQGKDPRPKKITLRQIREMVKEQRKVEEENQAVVGEAEGGEEVTEEWLEYEATEEGGEEYEVVEIEGMFVKSAGREGEEEELAYENDAGETEVLQLLAGDDSAEPVSSSKGSAARGDNVDEPAPTDTRARGDDSSDVRASDDMLGASDDNGDDMQASQQQVVIHVTDLKQELASGDGSCREHKNHLASDDEGDTSDADNKHNIILHQ